jgi:bifunctional DNase/RNase
MKRVDVLRISYYPPNKGYAVMLKEVEGERQVPIIVGSNEAQAIAMALEGVEMPRPMTHDLMLDIIHSLDVDIKHIIISNIRKGTFFAKITMSTLTSGDVTVDSRPSDAIAIGLRSMVPIFVEEVVFDSVGLIEQPESQNEESLQEGSQIMEPLTSSEDMLDNLNEALDRAVEEEEYEVAARLRDRIKEIEKGIQN